MRRLYPEELADPLQVAYVKSRHDWYADPEVGYPLPKRRVARNLRPEPNTLPPETESELG